MGRQMRPGTLEDAITSFFLGLATVYTLQRDLSQEYISETMMMIWAVSSDNFTLGNHLNNQIGKRLLWC